MRHPQTGQQTPSEGQAAPGPPLPGGPARPSHIPPMSSQHHACTHGGLGHFSGRTDRGSGARREGRRKGTSHPAPPCDLGP